jgi:ParB family chromosome partitioning protein
MAPVLSVNPFRCRLWHLHDRLEDHVNEVTCNGEIQSFTEHGQLVPVLGRRVQGETGYDIELIYGARRLFVARHINRPLLVELRELTDKEAIIAMDIENRHRKDLSPYERGLSYTRWLRAGYFESQEEMARVLKVSPSQVSRLLKMARLPSVVVNAFSSAIEICEGWGLDLIQALEYPAKRQTIVRKAREIAEQSPRPPAREVYRQLLASAAPGRKPKAQVRDQVFKDESGRPMFRIRQRRDAVVLILPIGRVSARCLDNIQLAVANILNGRRESPLEAPVARQPRPRHPVDGIPKLHGAST